MILHFHLKSVDLTLKTLIYDFLMENKKWIDYYKAVAKIVFEQCDEDRIIVKLPDLAADKVRENGSFY